MMLQFISAIIPSISIPGLIVYFCQKHSLPPVFICQALTSFFSYATALSRAHLVCSFNVRADCQCTHENNINSTSVTNYFIDIQTNLTESNTVGLYFYFIIIIMLHGLYNFNNTYIYINNTYKQ